VEVVAAAIGVDEVDGLCKVLALQKVTAEAANVVSFESESGRKLALDREVWLNPDTAWTWTHIYPAEAKVREIASGNLWQDGGLGERIAKQLCRELLLLESSDWQFLITTEAAADYATKRFNTHLDQFRSVSAAWDQFAAGGALKPETEARLEEIEERDNIFADIDPALWVKRID